MSAERPPKGLTEPWRAVWSEARAELQRLGLWSKARRRLLDLYVDALRDAQVHRELARAAPSRESRETGLPVVNPCWLAADRERKAAVSLADALGLTARAQKQLQKQADEASVDPDNPYKLLELVKPTRRRRSP
jgi:P27 family predicted phage terminase small subunit